MYIENIDCTYYGANGDAAKQRDQAKAALDGGAQVLVVELVPNSLFANEIITAAKEKNVPVIFFNCTLASGLIELFNSYDKCYFIESDISTIADVQGELIADYVKANYKNIDKNEDRTILATAYLSMLFSKDAVEKANELLATEDYAISTFPIFGEKFNLSVELVSDTQLLDSELILTDNDQLALAALIELQKNDYNTDKLVEKIIPIVTVGESVDYKALVLSGRGKYVSEDDLIKDDDDQKTIDAKNEKFKSNKELQDYYESQKYLVDLTSVKESELKEMVYTTRNVIDAGRIAGSAIEDKDAMAAAVAKVVKNLCQGIDFAKDLVAEPKEGEEPGVVVDGTTVKIRYTTYGK